MLGTAGKRELSPMVQMYSKLLFITLHLLTFLFNTAVFKSHIVY